MSPFSRKAKELKNHNGRLDVRQENERLGRDPAHGDLRGADRTGWYGPSLTSPFNIPSGSMIPTLLVGDYLFVSKFSYGYSRYSLPFGLPLVSDRVLADQPERGDVVVFKLPKDNETDYIKRLIGLPGDRIQVKGGVLHINGEAVARELLENPLLCRASRAGRSRSGNIWKPCPTGASI